MRIQWLICLSALVKYTRVQTTEDSAKIMDETLIGNLSKLGFEYKGNSDKLQDLSS